MRWLVCATAILVACSGDPITPADSGPAPGEELGACYGNGTCNAGLTCGSGVCVRLNSADAGDSGVEDQGSVDLGTPDADDLGVSDSGQDTGTADALPGLDAQPDAEVVDTSSPDSFFSVPMAIDPAAAIDSDDDYHPEIASDRAGTWITAWCPRFTGGTATKVSRSLDSGQSWSLPFTLGSGGNVAGIAGDGLGSWVAVWQRDGMGQPTQIVFRRSTDNALSWTPTSTLTDTAFGIEPNLATDRAGRWIAAWWSNSGDDGPDWDIVSSTSFDNGATWSDPIAINDNAVNDSSADQTVRLATDELGVWFATWVRHDPSTTPETDTVFVARSTSDGSSWEPARPIHTTMNGHNDLPYLSTDAAGVWILAWQSGDAILGSGLDIDILQSRSLDNGDTWSAPAPLNVNAVTDSGDDSAVSIAYVGGGQWLAVWGSTDSLAGTVGTEGDILVAQTFDRGATWSNPVAVAESAQTDQAPEFWPRLASDRVGAAVVVWQTQRVTGPFTSESDILGAFHW